MTYEIGDAKRFLKDKTNLTILLVIIVFITQSTMGYFLYANTVTIKKKIDHRYFCTTTSLEDINNVRIDTYNGSVRK